MSCEDRHEDISRLIDGSLDAAARRELEAHLYTCDGCAELADDLRRIRALAGSLEQREPPPAAWQAIARRTVAPAAGRDLWLGRVRRYAVPLATAACLVLAVAVVYLLKRPVPGPASGVTSAVSGTTTDRAALAGSVEAELRQAASHYENAIRGLETLARDQQGVDPQLAATLQKNLQLIDQAIGESRAALAREPA
ncbi:MAG TPA: zf-HC2 domain-containing protein, partial [Vicinamibacterales bacterium]|nr:zf-HC2 domain-containing protein [Vicinamibacterales bacterium]